jgi:hypothetical protein
MRIAAAVLLFALTPFACCAPAPFFRPERSPTWRVLTGRWAGDNFNVTISRGKYAYRLHGQCEFSLVIDTSHRPVRFRLTGLGGNAGSSIYLGILKVSASKLVMTYNHGQTGYPAVFDGQGRGAWVENFPVGARFISA